MVELQGFAKLQIRGSRHEQRQAQPDQCSHSAIIARIALRYSVSMLRGYALLLMAAVLLASSCSTQKAGLQPGPGFRKALQEALIQAKPGAVIEIPEGRHDIDTPLSLSVENVTLRGKGMDKSVLSFKNQATGSRG